MMPLLPRSSKSVYIPDAIIMTEMSLIAILLDTTGRTGGSEWNGTSRGAVFHGIHDVNNVRYKTTRVRRAAGWALHLKFNIEWDFIK